MDTARTLRPTTNDDTRTIARARLELTWTLRHTRGKASTLAARWIVVDSDSDAESRSAA